MSSTDGLPASDATSALGDQLRGVIALYEELQAQDALFQEQSVAAFSQATQTAGEFTDSIGRASQALDAAPVADFSRALDSLGATALRTVESVGEMTGSLLAKDLWNSDGVVRWDKAIRGLAQDLTARVITAVVSFALEQVLAAVATKGATVANVAYAESLYTVTAAYLALTAARAVAKAIPGLGMVFHEGGAVYHAGGPVRMHGGGLRPDERPAILQRGEYVLRREAVRRLGLPVLDAINGTGQVPSGTVAGTAASYQFTISALDGADVRRVVLDEIIPILEREHRRGRFQAPDRS